MSRKPTLDKWITTREAAQKLGCTGANIWMMIRANKIPGAQMRGGVYMLPVDAVAAAAQYRRRKYRCRNSAA